MFAIDLINFMHYVGSGGLIWEGILCKCVTQRQVHHMEDLAM